MLNKEKSQIPPRFATWGKPHTPKSNARRNALPCVGFKVGRTEELQASREHYGQLN